MTRGEQIIKEAKRIIAEAHERGDNNPMVDLAVTLSFSLGARWADKNPDIDVRTMAAWQSGYKEAIEKACEWLSVELEKEEELHYIHVHGFDKERRGIFIEQFRKAMEGGGQ